MISNNTKFTTPLFNAKGFTMIELMISLVIGAIMLGSIFVAYSSQQKSSVAQERVAEMQQNLRATMFPIIRDIRMAGYDPTGDAGTAGITVAQPGRIDMLMDLNGDGDTSDAGERIQFGYPVATDADNNGIPDNGNPASLGRQVDNAGGYLAIGDNLESFEFSYLDGDGNITANLSQIRSVQISLLARASRPDRDLVNNTEYEPGSFAITGVANANWKRAANTDNFRRRLLITTVVCRNMGL